MHLTPDGQITIPPEIRDQFGILPETELELEIEGNRLYIKKKQPADPISTWVATMRGTLQHVTTDQIISLTRDGETP
ncbi:AbrB/MazE/SpoVT family DNA-binding domain-containing protein [Phormidesmis priestleyi ULC007]|uniref:AbrB/MazE/SpoVT family DNA-binding domain-containing protein n=1 Tax=Phormidesmis priestleyi ULC007 TaxID=1920490 RepID=A0A2T1DAC1_9CYAN|nr:AbrB/MazE/SpoVT family DNA-binding domain-containing protein [Phormidesmis priestleyi]PSB17439.1 AbrB/MazE/SpoVT family DNA-binding domain-containing protein [Phormidesmis priestleyi ULC007]PZO48389.1 MAG: AbrB/MazE/SpoVT family DNA-binding domain-containing protein [Phormidesmis priestleyi]